VRIWRCFRGEETVLRNGVEAVRISMLVRMPEVVEHQLRMPHLHQSRLHQRRLPEADLKQAAEVLLRTTMYHSDVWDGVGHWTATPLNGSCKAGFNASDKQRHFIQIRSVRDMLRKNRIKAIPGTRRRMSELLLAESVPNVGAQGDIVRVRAGFARNYLVPQGLATIATDENKAAVEDHKKAQAAARKNQVKSLRDLAESVGKYSVTLEAHANKEGHLYGSILAADISAQLKAANFPIEASQVRLEGPLKETGMYTVKVQLDPEVDSEVKVWVVPKAGAVE
jgi:large subunit ribosomal protein L9